MQGKVTGFDVLTVKTIETGHAYNPTSYCWLRWRTALLRASALPESPPAASSVEPPEPAAHPPSAHPHPCVVPFTTGPGILTPGQPGSPTYQRAILHLYLTR